MLVPHATASANHNGSKARAVEKPLGPPQGSNASFVKDFITGINQAQLVHNLDKYDLRSGEETVVIVIQVHNRPEYLHHLLVSLRNAENIDKTLMIFSQDYYSEEVNKVIATVDFCPYMQIFYPYPVQIYTQQFPGDDPNDCPRDAKKDKAVKMGCINAQHPDKYGHYRESKYTQTKHHWFWKINHVFDHVTVMQHHTGPVLFIEEDHYLAADFIHILHHMSNLGKESCPDCSILTLGTYDKNPSYTNNAAKKPSPQIVEITDWVSNKHNMGMAINRKVWQKIAGCIEAFCRFDDYNWDWSLQFISMTCIKGRLKVMLMKSPRIFHIGECGMHKKNKNCNPAEPVRVVENLLSTNKKFLFPEKLSILGYPRSLARMPKPNGGWGDVRDHQLCISFTQPHTHR